MKTPHLRYISIVAALASMLACSTPLVTKSRPWPPSSPATQTSPAAQASSFNLDQLENDKAHMRGASQEARALDISDRWYHHAVSLQSIPGPGHLSSLLRSAQIALEILISETCQNPFNSTCHNLDRAYSRALDGIVRALAQSNWQSPNLAPSRYSFEPHSITDLQSLQGWKITLPTSSSDQPPLRPGLGLAAIGCRDLSLSGSVQPAALPLVCSPITFLLSFDRQSSADEIPVHLVALDAYQQEVVQIADHEVLLSANIDGTVQALGRNLQAPNGRPRLACLSLPTRTTTTLVVSGTPRSFTAELLDEIRRIPIDPTLRESFTPCLYVIPETLSAAVAAKDLLQTMREVVTPRGIARLEHDATPLFLAPTDEPSMCAMREALQRIRRQRRLIARGRLHGAPFHVRGVFATAAAHTAAESCLEPLTRETEELGISFNATQTSDEAPSERGYILALREMLYAARDTQSIPARASEVNASPTEMPPVDLPLSPVM
jgi:hypothetical protein